MRSDFLFLALCNIEQFRKVDPTHNCETLHTLGGVVAAAAAF